MYGGSVRLAEEDAAVGWPSVSEWGQFVTKTDFWVTDWARLWTGLAPVPGWPNDDAEATRWAYHLSCLEAQRAFALRLLGRRLRRLALGPVSDAKSAFLRALKVFAGEQCDAIRVQFYRELRAAEGEGVVDRTDLSTAHLGIASSLSPSLRRRVDTRRRRPTVREMLTLNED